MTPESSQTWRVPTSAMLHEEMSWSCILRFCLLLRRGMCWRFKWCSLTNTNIDGVQFFYNREPKFWEHTRAYSDVYAINSPSQTCMSHCWQISAKTITYSGRFHGSTHLCSSAYKAKKLTALRSNTNTSVAEQFNSFGQKIKHCASSMSLPHYVLQLQARAMSVPIVKCNSQITLLVRH